MRAGGWGGRAACTAGRTSTWTSSRTTRRWSGLRLADVDHPRDAEPVHAHAELVAPRLLLQGHRHGAAVRQLLPVAAQLVGVVPAQADGDVVAGVALHPLRGVGGHEREPAGRLELAVHDLVGVGRVLRAELAEGVHPQLAAEDVPVELQGLPRA